MSANLKQTLEQRIRQVVGAMTNAVRATPPDRLEWKPLDSGRGVMDQLRECVFINATCTVYIRERQFSPHPPDLRAQVDELTGLDDLLAQLQETSKALLEATLQISDEELDQVIQAPWGPWKLWDICFHAYWNMVYHEGQINYIQTLYGDNETRWYAA